MHDQKPFDLIPVKDALALLGVSHSKMTQLIRDGVIITYPNVLDRREKLVSKADIVALRPYRAEAA